MTAVDVATEWGVRHSAHSAPSPNPHQVEAVDVCADEATARRFRDALVSCGGNNDAELVWRAAGSEGAWITVGGAA